MQSNMSEKIELAPRTSVGLLRKQGVLSLAGGPDLAKPLHLGGRQWVPIKFAVY